MSRMTFKAPGLVASAKAATQSLTGMQRLTRGLTLARPLERRSIALERRPHLEPTIVISFTTISEVSTVVRP